MEIRFKTPARRRINPAKTAAPRFSTLAILLATKPATKEAIPCEVKTKIKALKGKLEMCLINPSLSDGVIPSGRGKMPLLMYVPSVITIIPAMTPVRMDNIRFAISLLVSFKMQKF